LTLQAALGCLPPLLVARHGWYSSDGRVLRRGAARRPERARAPRVGPRV
jgi:hypothetical protein